MGEKEERCRIMLELCLKPEIEKIDGLEAYIAFAAYSITAKY